VTVSGTLSRNASSTINLDAGGTLQIGTGTTGGVLLGGTGSFVNNGTLIFNRSNASTYSGVLSGSGAVVKQGAGALTLSGSNTYSGGTTVSAGSLVGTTSSLQGAIANDAVVSFNQATDGTYSGNMSGSGSLTKLGAGVVTLSGSNAYSGGTTLTAGILALSGTGSIGTGGLNLGTTGGGAFDLGGLTAATYSLPATGNLTGVGTLTGSGKTLGVLGSFQPGANLGTVTLDSGFRLDLSSSGTSVFQITSPSYTAGTFDLVSGSGTVILGGVLNLDFSGGTYADGADVLQLFNNTGGLSGTFSAVNFTGLGAGQSATFNPVTGFISLVPEPSSLAAAFAGLACGCMVLRRRRTGSVENP